MRQSCRQEHLYAIRNDTLHCTGERVEDTGRLAWVYPVFLTDLPGDVAYRKDGDRVVGCAEVDKTDKGCDGELSPRLP